MGKRVLSSTSDLMVLWAHLFSKAIRDICVGYRGAEKNSHHWGTQTRCRVLSEVLVKTLPETAVSWSQTHDCFLPCPHRGELSYTRPACTFSFLVSESGDVHEPTVPLPSRVLWRVVLYMDLPRKPKTHPEPKLTWPGTNIMWVESPVLCTPDGQYQVPVSRICAAHPVSRPLLFAEHSRYRFQRGMTGTKAEACTWLAHDKWSHPLPTACLAFH